MTPLKIETLRKNHRLTRSEFGSLVYQTERAVKSWERGERCIPEAIWELLLYKLDGVEPTRPTFISPDQGVLL